MAVKNPTSKRHTVESHFLVIGLSVLLYFVLPPAAVLFLSILTLASFVASLVVPR